LREVQRELHRGVNVLKVNLQQSIQILHARGWSRRRIARELGVHRKTVASYLGEAKRPFSTTGSGEDESAKAAISTAGSAAGRVSLCREFLPTITASVNAGLSATRIYQDLVDDHGFSGSYESVKRCVRNLAKQLELPHRRLECAAGGRGARESVRTSQP